MAARVETNGLTALETASHVVIGHDRPAAHRPEREPSASAALEQLLLPALRRPPCFVGFSGGRDSSALLASATRVARREGLPDPIPSILRFAGAPATEEHEWQELVIGHLGLTERLCQTFTDELDLVGPVAAQIMLRDGLPYPYNLHLLAPLIEHAAGGSFISGLGGDQVLGTAGHLVDVLARRSPPRPRDALRLGVALSPPMIRRRVFRDRVGLTFPWLRPSANTALTGAWLEQYIRQPLRWDRRMHDLWRSRLMQMTAERIASVGEHSDAEVHHPFAHEDFIFALTREVGPTGFSSRTAAFEFLFGDLLPAAVISRRTKAVFNDVLWSDHARALVASLDEDAIAGILAGLGLDTLVDPRALTEHWREEAPLANSFLLLQACWLALR